MKGIIVVDLNVGAVEDAEHFFLKDCNTDKYMIDKP